jgi:ABC-type multidrug transport system fused ATPase/permease subunit
VEFIDLGFSYREGLPQVLSGVSASLPSLTKCGVAGRTGSGKSSLMLLLFRMYELEHGKVTIDGIDISKIGLHTLRKKIAIIPQDPVIFSGDIRGNLDPFKQYSDAALWDCLEQVRLTPL